MVDDGVGSCYDKETERKKGKISKKIHYYGWLNSTVLPARINKMVAPMTDAIPKQRLADSRKALPPKSTLAALVPGAQLLGAGVG